MELTQAQKDLVEKNINLVYSVVNRLNVKGNEDAVQEGIMGLCMASSRYRGEEVAKFSTYATYYIRGYVLSYINRKNGLIRPLRVKNKHIHPEIIFEDDFNFVDNNNQNAGVDLDCDIKRKLNQLDDSYKLLYQLLLLDMRQVDIAKVMNISQTLVTRMVAKLRNYLEDLK